MGQLVMYAEDYNKKVLIWTTFTFKQMAKSDTCQRLQPSVSSSVIACYKHLLTVSDCAFLVAVARTWKLEQFAFSCLSASSLPVFGARLKQGEARK